MMSTNALSETLNPDKSSSKTNNLFLDNMALVVEIEKTLLAQYKDGVNKLQ